MPTILVFSLLAAGAFYAALLAGPQVDDLRWREWHHGYLGQLMITAGVALPWPWAGEALALLGLLILAEDAGQHAAQRWSRSATINHRSAFWHFWQDWSPK